MFTTNDTISLSLEELTWLSASTLIENQYALSESSSPERDAKALLRAVFHHSLDASVDSDDEGSPADGKLSSRCNSPHTFTASPQRPQGPSGSMSTPSIDSPSTSSLSRIASPFQSGGQPITPPPTPPRHHYIPRHLSHDYPSSSNSPSPSPSVSSSALSSTTRLHQTEWIYRRPKSSSPAANSNSLASRHRSASVNASCPSPQLSRSPSISSRTHRDDTSPSSNSKLRRHAAAMPRPSSPVLISSTSQLVDSPKSIAKTPSNAIGVRGAANASVSSLQLQSAIRVSPLKHRTHRSPYSPTDKSPDPNAPPGVVPPSLQRSTSSTSAQTTNSASTAIWSAIRAKSGTSAERNRTLKSIPSRSQIVTGSSVTPTFAVPVPLTSSLPTPPRDAIPPRVPPKDRHTFNGTATSLPIPSSSHTDKDRRAHRRDKFASAPPIPVPAGANAPPTRFGDKNSSSAPSPSHMGGGTSTSPSSLSGASNSTIRISPNSRSRVSRNRTASLNSQSSIATATTSHTAATTGTTSSSTSSRLHPYTPTTPSSSIPVSPGIYNSRTSSHSSTGTPSPYLHGFGRGDKNYFHQRQNSTSSNIGINDGSTAAAVVARSQAYAQLTGAARARRRPSTSPDSEAPSYLHLYSHPHSYSYQSRPGFGGPSVSGFRGGNHASAGTLIAMPLSASTRHPSLPPPASSSVSLSHHGSSYGSSHASRSPRIPTTPQPSQISPPKAKSILTRTSSMSTKNSGCGGTVKSVKFVEIPEIHYRSGFSEEDSNDYIYGEASDVGDEVGDDDDDVSAVGAKGEGQEGIVLKECMGIDVEAIDMDIDTYLGNGPLEEEKEGKLNFKRKQGLGWNFLRGRKHERETDEGKQVKQIDDEKEPAPEQKKEKEKSSSTLGFRKLMGLTSRKAPPPPLTLSIGHPIPINFKPLPTPVHENTNTSDTSKKRTSVSPTRKPISGPYALGSHIPSRPPPPPSPSSSFIHQSSAAPARSPSNTSLNRLYGSLSRRHHHNYSSTSVNHGHKTNPNTHGRSQSSMPYSGPLRSGSLERAVGPNIAHTRPKGIIGQDVPGLDSATGPIPLKNAPSYESFRSAMSYGGRSVRSEVGSVKSSKSVGTGSLRGFRTWVNKVSARGIPVAVAE